MNSQIAVKEENMDYMIKEIQEMQNMCAQLMKTKHYQAMGEAGMFAIIQKAKSLNINALEALNGGLYYVQGKVGMSSEMMASLIRQKSHSIIKDPKSDSTVCILHGKRADNGDTWTITFSMDDARRAGLAKNMYEKYPAIMLYNRAMSMLARQLFPDVIKGAGYTMDELKEIKENNPILQLVSVNEVPEITYTKEEEDENLNKYLSEVVRPEEYELAREYFQKRAAHFSKSITSTIAEYDEDTMRFVSDFQKWKSKQQKAA